jgi:hypothetical protein
LNKDWQMRDKKIWYHLPVAEQTVFDRHLSFFTSKSHDECSATL